MRDLEETCSQVHRLDRSLLFRMTASTSGKNLLGLLRLYVLDYYFSPSPLCIMATSFCRLRTPFSPYLLHASPSPLLYCLCAHQYLLIHDDCTPFVPASPHHYLMYHCTIGACFLPLLHVYYHAPYTCLRSISTGRCSALYSRLDFLSNQAAFHLLVH